MNVRNSARVWLLPDMGPPGITLGAMFTFRRKPVRRPAESRDRQQPVYVGRIPAAHHAAALRDPRVREILEQASATFKAPNSRY
jgi:hypothetical protein